MEMFIDKIKNGEPIVYYDIETSKEEVKQCFLNAFHKNGKSGYTKHRKQRNYPLWMLKLLYSQFFRPMLDFKRVTSKNWKELGIDLDGDIILATRRFSKRNDKIVINVINNGGYFTIFEKGTFCV